ncbi:Uncharacterised protein [Escherichia coli]|nr:Uncharacterised protein [Escherichia coli]
MFWMIAGVIELCLSILFKSRGATYQNSNGKKLVGSSWEIY